ncbi:MAG: L-seryl-tRNA(Sec) selenium transferase [Deltaproteobacteria bacterium]|nr:L-seryl-tRNA(Sec) selenium transferase [Deltaproteobacteria bacterium]
MDDLLGGVKDELGSLLSIAVIKRLCQQVVSKKREELLAEMTAAGSPTILKSKEELREAIIGEVMFLATSLINPRLKRVINATGVVLHTNLGRSPLSARALCGVVASAMGYSNLEFSLEDGKRGLRYDNLRELICSITGAEDVVVVNNNAAAVMLILDTIAFGREVIVSRGELVEIGGGFRVPDVMKKSGALLKEVGTTNRTHIDDYARALTSSTGLLLKVHASNFKMVGFCNDTPLSELVALGREHRIPVAYDVGSGSLVDLSRYGIEGEPMLAEILASGVDVISISGDKLLGGPQAGIILGKREVIQTIAQNPLNRALRVDKLTLAALEGTLIDYLQDEEVVCQSIYPLRYISRTPAFLKKEARILTKTIKKSCGNKFSLEELAGKSFAGGGALPGYELDSILVALENATLTAEQIATKLRMAEVPVIVRVANDKVLFDLRTLEQDDYAEIALALCELL